MIKGNRHYDKPINTSGIKYNAWCSECKKIVQVDTEDNPKCPKCKSKVDVKGKAIRVITSNGPYTPHF